MLIWRTKNGSCPHLSNWSFIYIQAIVDDFPAASVPTVCAYATAHEFAHQFNLGGIDYGHVDVWCHEGPNTDHCMMDFRSDKTDNYIELCYNELHQDGDHITAIRNAEDDLDEYN